MYLCLVCGYNQLEEEAYGEEYPSHEICSSCSFQYGVDDKKGSQYDEWRKTWLNDGGEFWYLPDKPKNWDIEEQLARINIKIERISKTDEKPSIEQSGVNYLNEKGDICPVCHYDGLDEPAYDDMGSGSHDICSCCGFQFGLRDFPHKMKGIQKWREKWISNDCVWRFSEYAPKDWHPANQLISLIKDSSLDQ